MEIKLNTYGSIISDDTIGKEIVSKIQAGLLLNLPVVIDFSDVISITTFNAKQIFGHFYKTLGAQGFVKNILLKNASDNIQTIIKLGIRESIE
jgi:anti-anti-sigma regulatory factor